MSDGRRDEDGVIIKKTKRVSSPIDLQIGSGRAMTANKSCVSWNGRGIWRKDRDEICRGEHVPQGETELEQEVNGGSGI